MSTATAPKPLTFRRWYNGNLFHESSAWVTDGRAMILRDSLRTKGARTLATKRTRDHAHQHNDGDAKARVVIDGASPRTWATVAINVGIYEALGYRLDNSDIPGRPFHVFEYRTAPDAASVYVLFEPVAVAWMLEHVQWSGLNIDPTRAALWFVGLFGKPLALLMPISVPAEVTACDAFRAWRRGMP